MQKDWATTGCRVFRPIPGEPSRAPRLGARFCSFGGFCSLGAGRLGWEPALVRPAACVWSGGAGAPLEVRRDFGRIVAWPVGHFFLLSLVPNRISRSGVG